MRNVLKKTLLATAVASAALASSAAMAEVTGNVSVVSKYVLRGITTAMENNNTAIQGGLDYASESGFYAGYWGSNLSYSLSTDADTPETGFENDFYAGYAGEAGSFSYDVGLIYYYYMGVDDADAPELAASVGFGPVTLGMKYLMDDVIWGNEGDIYWTASAGTDLPMDFSLSGTLGFYTYDDDDAGNDFIPNGTTTEDSGFRHLDLTLSHPLADTGADMSMTYIVGGKDRGGNDQGDTVVFGISYGF
jgi:uncharacterized protein (TIGR02001 family)